MPPKIYDYRVMKLTSVLPLVTCAEVEMMPDVYVADDNEARFYSSILQDGFRWVRTDSGYAIFERTV